MKFLKNYFKEIGIGLMIGLILIILLQKLFLIATIPSESMETTLLVGDKVYIKTNYKNIERGKIYTFVNDNSYMIKRCIGIPGDHIKVINDDVYLNGEKLEESYVSSKNKEDKIINMDFIVPEGKLFFLGDNRRVSNDARYWNNTFIDEDDVIGLATRVIYPFNRAGSLYKEEGEN